ncbi:DUF4412 domain-containing protein [Marinilabilia rubra]|uniref:Uncharacterized protein n=1 Tax=Marinilabilia rubra TaxID=2162893 RepID=A0A2U2BDT0_9BACT|nr:DUF4412 domain-containing protein [Marinilabilia rubra]PWE01224.1 hypothetical protein DDZ16_01680 [Marinilabilia rubra]
MKFYVKTCLLLMFLSFSISSFSQGFLERVAKKASEKIEKKAEKKAEEKMDEKIDEGFDEAEESLEGRKEQEPESNKRQSSKRMEEMMKKMGVSSEPAPVADQYEFSSKMRMEFQNYDEKGKLKDEGEVVTFISPGEKNFAYEFLSGTPDNSRGPAKGIFIMDYENGSTIILSEEDGEKSGVVYGIKFFDEAVQDDDPEYTEEYEEKQDINYTSPGFKKTGRTKDILGYKCNEYAFDDEESEGTVWITEKIDWKAKDTFSTIFKSAMTARGIYNGMMLESESKDKSSGEVNKMQVTEIDDNANKVFSPGEYQLVNMGSMNFRQGEE